VVIGLDRARFCTLPTSAIRWGNGKNLRDGRKAEDDAGTPLQSSAGEVLSNASRWKMEQSTVEMKPQDKAPVGRSRTCCVKDRTDGVQVSPRTIGTKGAENHQ
jgi:hypothetical protein